MKLNRKVFIFIIIVITLMAFKPESSQQTVVPSCIEKDDCKVALKPGYCEVRYECIQGKCYHSFKLCPEICEGGIDEDKDGSIDCDDTDCWNSPYCLCDGMPFEKCIPGRCYCPDGKSPSWIVSDGKGIECRCGT